MRRHRLGVVEEGILRTHIRTFLREAEVPRSEIVDLRAASDTFRPIGTPGATALKVVGVLLATSWLAQYVKQDCITGALNPGMPIPEAYKFYIKFSGGQAVGTAATTVGANDPAQASKEKAVQDWSSGIQRDIYGDPSASDDYHRLGGLQGLFRYIAANINGASSKTAGTVWPNNRELKEFSGENSQVVHNLSNPSTEYDRLLAFVMDILNRQCEGAVNASNVDKIVREKLKTRQEFIKFMQTYNDTLYKDFVSIVESHKKSFAEAGLKPTPDAEAAIKSVTLEYTKASQNIY